MIQLTGRDKLPANLNTCLLYRFNCVQVGFHLHCAALLHHEHSSSPGLLAVLKGLTEEGIDHIPKDRRRADMRAKLDAKNIWKAVIKNYESVPEWEPVRLAQRECKAGILSQGRRRATHYECMSLKKPASWRQVGRTHHCVCQRIRNHHFVPFSESRKKDGKAPFHLQSPSSPTWDGHCLWTTTASWWGDTGPFISISHDGCLRT